MTNNNTQKKLSNEKYKNDALPKIFELPKINSYLSQAYKNNNKFYFSFSPSVFVATPLLLFARNRYFSSLQMYLNS